MFVFDSYSIVLTHFVQPCFLNAPGSQTVSSLKSQLWAQNGDMHLLPNVTLLWSKSSEIVGSMSSNMRK